MFPLTPQFVKDNYLVGIPLETPGGKPFTQEFMENRIKAVRYAFERKYGVRFEPTVIKMGSYGLQGDPAHIDERLVGNDLHPDDIKDHKSHSMLLPVGPIKGFLGLGLWLPGLQNAATFDMDWIHPNPPDPRTRRIRISPGRSITSVLTLQGLMGMLLPMSGGGRPIAGAWHITYTAGYTEQDLLGQDFDVLDALGKLAAIALLTKGSVDQNMIAGITNKSLSADGLSQSVGLAGNAENLKYGAIIKQLAGEFAEWEKAYWARSGRGIKFIVA